ncbi:MAG: hypothetical protein N3I86_07515 [Verrucomicrobiae bacterium]|nr:hypothetical protein [Verrucomicrobiae bacterium]
MGRLSDVQVVGSALYFLPIRTRVPLKFGAEVLTEVTCARARVTVVDRRGRRAEGWGETPLSVQWVWPGAIPWEERHAALKAFCQRLAARWAQGEFTGHPIEVGHDFLCGPLRDMLRDFNAQERAGREPMPRLAALLCCSALDLALHDAFGCLHGVPTYATYGPDWMSRDLAAFLEPAPDVAVTFRGRYPAEFLVLNPPKQLVAWHLVGGLDALEASELTGDEPRDGYPVTLCDWIRRDGLQCLKVKLRGDDAAWDFERLRRVAAIGQDLGVKWLSADFNCTVREPSYVNAVLDRLAADAPRAWEMILYVEQPFPYDLEAWPLDVRSVAARKPLFLDESAHDWRVVRRGRELGWTGVALKTCKTQTGALLSACWARAHGMSLMVQDLTNPMLAMIPHVLLAAHVETIQGVETNAVQFYPEASRPEAAVHLGLYERRAGRVDWGSVWGPGFGYRIPEILRVLPEPAARFEP